MGPAPPSHPVSTLFMSACPHSPQALQGQEPDRGRGWEEPSGWGPAARAGEGVEGRGDSGSYFREAVKEDTQETRDRQAFQGSGAGENPISFLE